MEYQQLPSPSIASLSLNPRLYFLICSVSSVIDDMEEEILIGWLCTSAVTTLGTTEEVVLEDVEGKATVT